MKPATIGFLGGGRIVSIMLRGWRKDGKRLGDAVISDPASPVATTRYNREAAAQECVCVAVHPPEVMDLIPIHPFGAKEPIIDEFYRVQLPSLSEKIRP